MPETGNTIEWAYALFGLAGDATGFMLCAAALVSTLLFALRVRIASICLISLKIHKAAESKRLLITMIPRPMITSLLRIGALLALCLSDWSSTSSFKP
jgi:hypothetical protein